MHFPWLRSTTFAAFVLLEMVPIALAAEAVQFNYLLPQVGQEGVHQLHFDLNLNIMLRQGGKTVSDEKRGLIRDQQRHVTVLATTGDRATKVRVHFAKAQETLTQGSQPSEKRRLPIDGKSYLIERQAADLLITDPDGNPVPEEQRVLVAASMDSVGRQNPLARYLHGRTVEVGQTLKLPKEMAADLLGMRETVGDAQKVELTLRGVRSDQDRSLADFVTAVQFKRGSGQALNVEGQLQIDVDTCHVVAADFSGPVSGKQDQAGNGDAYELSTDGTLTASVRSQYLK